MSDQQISPPDQNPSNADNTKMSKSTIIGIVIGCVVVVVLLLCFVFWKKHVKLNPGQNSLADIQKKNFKILKQNNSNLAKLFNE